MRTRKYLSPSIESLHFGLGDLVKLEVTDVVKEIRTGYDALLRGVEDTGERIITLHLKKGPQFVWHEGFAPPQEDMGWVELSER